MPYGKSDSHRKEGLGNQVTAKECGPHPWSLWATIPSPGAKRGFLWLLSACLPAPCASLAAPLTFQWTPPVFTYG